MKKIIISIIIICYCLTINVNAKSCTPITGNGKEIGDELDCAGERFYVIDNSKDELKLMAKYNLMTNGKCDLFMFDSVIPNGSFNQLREARNQIINEQYPNYDENDRTFYLEEKLDENNNYLGLKICYFGSYENSRTYKQDEKAIAFKGNVNDIQFPYEGLFPSKAFKEPTNYYLKEDPNNSIASVIDFISGHGFEYSYRFNPFKGFYNTYFFDYVLSDNTDEYKIYKSYKDFLEENDIKIKNISNLTAPELIDLINKVSERKFNLNNYSNPQNWQVITGRDNYTGISSSHTVIADLKEFIPEQYKWIYSTTYWLNTFSIHESALGEMFVITLGELCIDRAMCSHPSVGLRPIISIEKYTIESKTNGHGRIEVIDSALEGDSITFKVINNKGYVLSSVTITTESGKKITFNREDIKDNKDGTYTVNNSFIMPGENIIIEGRFNLEIINPNTRNILTIVLLFYAILLTTGIIIKSLKHKNIKRTI